MSLNVSFTKAPKAKSDTLAVPVFEGGKLSAVARQVDKENGGLISHHLGDDAKFKGDAGQIMGLTAPKNKKSYKRIVLVGFGDPAKLDEYGCELAGAKLFAALGGAQKIAFHADFENSKKLNAAQAAASFAAGFELRSYRFDKYKTGKKERKGVQALEVIVSSAEKAKAAHREKQSAVSGVFFARDCVNEPPNNLYPDSFAKAIAKELRPLGVEVEIFDEKKMKALGFEAHLAVGMGSARPPRVVVMRWAGGKSGGRKGKAARLENPVALVGKGVTFDTGGVNLKPADGMLDMKMDMAGAAAVAGVMRALAARKSKAHVVGIAGLAENMPSHIAYRPSDVIGSLAGKTIEVMNTDAEGRLVLADCLTYVQQKYKPQFVIDLATLTGAMMIALGHEYCGAFVNDDKLWANMDGAGKATGEKLWRMPLDDAYRKETEGTVSDIKSTGNGRYGGACTAAGFLERFIEGKTPWAHMDIAGTAWMGRDSALGPKPATGFGVRLLDRMIADNYE